uniref:Uncharacterized protein n=1 Tax=Rhizophora mucronata TaxID=61149 RepID=A0A2P2P448_RHIMU
MTCSKHGNTRLIKTITIQSKE